MTHRLPSSPLHWTRIEGIWLAKMQGCEFEVRRESSCDRRCWTLWSTCPTGLRQLGTFFTLHAAKAVAEAIERG